MPTARPSHILLFDAADVLGLVTSYRDGSISAADRLRLVHAVGLIAGERLRHLALDLLAVLNPDRFGREKAWGDKAREAIGTFFGKARKLVRTAVLAGSLALFGPDMPADAKEATAVQIARQDGYLQQFQQQVVSGGQSPGIERPSGSPPPPIPPPIMAVQPPNGTLAARATMYGHATWLATQNAGRAVAKARGMVAERRVLGPADHCLVCPEQSDLGWQPLGLLLNIGDTPCKVECRCRYEYKDARGNVHDIPPEKLIR